MFLIVRIYRQAAPMRPRRRRLKKGNGPPTPIVKQGNFKAPFTLHALRILEKQKPTALAATSAVPALPQRPIRTKSD
jgi:hypothetical protein